MASDGRSPVTFALAVIGMAGLPAVAAGATTYYVSSGQGAGARSAGDDGAPGTEERPFRTLRKAVSVLKPGDTLIVRGGEYDTENGLSADGGNSGLPSGTSWDHPTVLGAYKDEKPVFRRYMPQGAGVDETTYRDSWHLATPEECAAVGLGKNYPYDCWDGGTSGGLQEQTSYPSVGPAGYVLQMSNEPSKPVEYVVIAGIDIDARGICNTLTFGAGARHLRFQDLEIRDSIRSGVSQPDVPSDIETDLQFIRVKIHGCGVPYDKHVINGAPARKHPYAKFRHPWYMHSGGNSLIDSETYDCAGTGLGPDGNNNIIVGNSIHDNNSAGIYIAGGDGWRISNNVFFNNGGAEIYHYSGGKHVISNNTVVAGRPDNPNRAVYGIFVLEQSWDSLYENNIVVGFRYGIANQSLDLRPGTYRNNLIVSSPYPRYEFFEQYAKVPGIKRDNILGLDPLFVAPAALDFRLQAGSPAIDKGHPNGLKSDRRGAARPQGAAVDIGAFEFCVEGK